MGIVSRLGRPQAINKEMERLILEAFGGGSTSSGVSVNSDNAMRLITVQNCVRVRAFTISQLPCHTMERVGKNKNKAEDFYLYELLHDQPNSWMTASEFWAMAEAYVSLRGNFIAYKAYGTNGKIRELIPINCNFIRNITQNPDYTIDYEIVFPDGSVKHLNNSQVLHLRGLTLNGYSGVNPIEYARETVGLGLASEKFLSRFFGHGMHPGAVIKHPASLNAPQHSDLKKRLKEKYEGLGNTHEFMLLDEGMEITFPDIKLVDAQFLEQMKMTESQICGLFRVPLMLIQSGDKAPTYASAEQFAISYAVHGVTPDVVNYEKSLRRDLLTPEERKRYFVKFNIDGLLRGDFKTRMEGLQIGVNTEILSPNEARDWFDLNPYKGGDEYRTRTSTIKQDNKDNSSNKDTNNNKSGNTEGK